MRLNYEMRKNLNDCEIESIRKDVFRIQSRDQHRFSLSVVEAVEVVLRRVVP